jgi:beta-glucosidase-like glycosyl hydrolase
VRLLAAILALSCLFTASGRAEGIPIKEALELESKLGQLFIVNVDGFGYEGPLALAPAYGAMVERLQIGGVIPHYGSTDYERIRRTNRALASMTKLPLLICCDLVKLAGASRVGAFGDGYIGGFLGRFRRMPDAELSTLAELNAFVLAAVGINVALGPTVDDSTGDWRAADRAALALAALRRFGLQPVLKHYPFLPASANLHRQSPDTKVALRDVEKRVAVFRKLADEPGIMMTTHLFDTKVDHTVATFSRAWTSLLRRQTGFEGLLMSDGLLMLRNYTDRAPLAGGPPASEVKGLDQAAVWALRAILAGHDLLIVEGSAAQTVKAFEGVLEVACRDSLLGREARARILASAKRIERFKLDRRAALTRALSVPASAIDAVIALLPPENASLASFKFDAERLALLGPALRAASVTSKWFGPAR